MLADLQLDIASAAYDFGYVLASPNQIMMISTLCGSRNVCDHQKERSLKTVCVS